MMSILLGSSFAITTCLIALLHFYWAVGGRLGMTAAVPGRGNKPLFTPSPLATAFVGIALLLSAVVSLQYIRVLSLPLPRGLVSPCMWSLGIVFLVRAVGDFNYVGFFKRQLGTRFAKLDSRFYSPLCLLLAALVFGAIYTVPAATSPFN